MKNVFYNFKFLCIALLVVSSTSYADEESDLFAKVFANPGDLTLNYELAQVQIANKNYKGAAASLERILVRFEGETTVQLLLAKVNLQLKNPTEARRLYLAVINNKNAPEENLIEARQEYALLTDNVNDSKDWGLNGSISASFGKKDNARSASDDNKVLLGGVVYESDVEGDPEYLRTGIVNLNLFKDVGNDTKLFAGVYFSAKDINTYNDGDSDTYHYSIGADTTMLNGMTRFTVQGGQMYLNTKKFINYYGVNIDHRRLLAPTWVLSFGVGSTKLEFQEYDGIVDNTDKAGVANKVFVSLDKSWRRFGANARYTKGQTNAEKDWFSYESEQLDTRLTTDYGRGLTSIFYTIAENDYELANPTIDTTIREDTFVSYGFNYQISLTNFNVPQPNDWVGSWKYAWGENRSNVANYKREDDREWTVTISKYF